MRVEREQAAVPGVQLSANGWSSERILVVDADPDARDRAICLLERMGHRCDSAGDAPEAMQLLATAGDGYALALCDICIPGVSGMDLARHMVAEYPDTAVLMVTSVEDPLVAETALSFGVFGYVLKPYRPLELTSAVSAALRRRELCMESRRSRDALERRVEEQTAELRVAVHQLQEKAGTMRLSQDQAVRRLARAIEFRSRETGDHVERVADTCALLGARLGLDERQCELLRVASSMHDVGKVAVPDSILMKPGALDEAERRQMEQHTCIGHDVLTGSGSEVLQLAATIALTHHERFDGSGYPDGLRREAIPLEGRIVAVADVFDALTHERVYRPAMTEGAALGVLCDGRGKHFDPRVLDCFLSSMNEVRAVAGGHAA